MKTLHLPAWILVSAALLSAGCPGTDDKPDDTDETDIDSDPDSDTETDDTDTETDDTDTETDDTDTETDHTDTETDDTDTETDDTDTETDDTDTDEPIDTSTVVVPAGLILTEIVDHTNASVAYVEICNPTDQPVSLSGWGLKIFRNGSASGVRSVLRTTETLDPGEAYVVANSAASGPTYNTLFGDFPDQFEAAIDGNGNDVYVLEYQHRRVDVYGVVGQAPAAGSSWNYADKVANRDDAVVAPTTTWTSSEWVIDGDYASFTSIGRCTDEVDTDVDTEIDTDTDTYEPFTGHTFETGPVDTGEPPVILDVTALAVGDLVISEIMVDPAACTDNRGQYVAFRSRLADRIDLTGLVLENSLGDTISLTALDPVRPGQEVVAWLDPGTPPGHCYFPPGFDLPYTGVFLEPAGDVVLLKVGSTVIDQVDFRTWSGTEGNAWELSGDKEDAILNNDAANWCEARFPIPGSTDLGSPSLGNDVCPAPDTDTDTVETDTTPPDTDTDTDTGPDRIALADLAVGDLVITEMLMDPSTPCSDDANGEYIEVYNTTALNIDLTGLQILSKSGTATVEPGAHIEPEEAVVLYRTPVATACFPFATTIAYDAYAYDATWVFDDVNGDFVTIREGSRDLDTVDVRAWTVKASRGAAYSLDRDSVDTSDNDFESAWCTAGYSTGPGNIGSVGNLIDCPVIETGIAVP